MVRHSSRDGKTAEEAWTIVRFLRNEKELAVTQLERQQQECRWVRVSCVVVPCFRLMSRVRPILTGEGSDSLLLYVCAAIIA